MKNPVSKKSNRETNPIRRMSWHTGVIFLILMLLTVLMALLLKSLITGSVVESPEVTSSSSLASQTR